ncbi:MAG: zinc ribbon domain-containing protein [Xanthomonadales bacterium]|nr:zinc ribbon domain-containing protein [Xanthomonadales bacterium]
MPIYEYLPKGEARCDYCTEGFELMRKISDPALDRCPNCGAAVERRISAASVPRASPSLDPANLEKHGFTQYRRSGKGVYEKAAGKGPKTIKDE